MRIAIRQTPSTGVLVLIATFHASGRPATVRHLIGDGLHGVLRTIGWSFGLALAILLLTASTTAKAADPDGETSLFGGPGDGLGGIIDPITDVAEPVTTMLEPLTDPLAETVVEPITEIVEPLTSAVEPVTPALVEPVTAAVAPLVEPVDDLLDPVLEPIVGPLVQPLSDVVTSVTEPVTQIVDPLVEPILEGPIAEPGSAGGTPQPAGPVQAPALPAVDVVLPAFAPILPILPAEPAVSAPSAPSGPPTVTSAVAGPAGASDAGRIAVGNGAEGTIWTPPSDVAGLIASSSAEPEPATPRWTRLGPIGSFGGLGSGQTLNGVAFGLGVALGLLLLFLLPPPFRVSRLHLAAVSWRPQHFVGPLVPPG